MATFRELFDEAERDELLTAVIARKNALVSRRNKARDRTEQAPNAATIERLEKGIEMNERIIKTIIEESN
mgnify:CR=1 FL=1